MPKTSRKWWHGAAIYQIYPRSFFDTNGDGVGDLPGIITKLPYVAELGVDGIWISPFFTSPMDDFGYDVADYRDVDPVFGDLADFKELVKMAHDLDLRVIIDQVYSHSSNQHVWFQESRENRTNPKADWYVWADPKPDGSPPNNWQSVFGGVSWSWDNRRKQYYLHNFLPTQPDLNLHNEKVQKALIEVAEYWLNLGVDGFRLDAVNFGMHDLELRDNPPNEDFSEKDYRPFVMQKQKYNLAHPKMPAFFEKLCSTLEAYGDILTVAEVGGADPEPTMKDYTKGDKRLSSAYSFDFLSLSEIKPSKFKEILKRWPGEDSAEGWPSWAFSNHDAPRVVSRWLSPEVPDGRLAKLYLLLLASIRGNIFIYQGEELGLMQAEVAFEDLQDPEAISNWPDNLGRDGARTPFPWKANEKNLGFSKGKTWLPVFHKHGPLAFDQQIIDVDSTLNFARQILALRKNEDALRYGSLDFIETESDLIAFKREKSGESLLCLFNLTGRDLSFDMLKTRVKEVIISTGEKSRIVEKHSGLIGRI